ncbi:hypothetical protein [Leifsonia sp. NPDC058230]|uniref:hypothetical protein n=1 Tax=Leifsonia sp. NPDC058230 TaxID=3346391 RepID=UPI0036DF039E
MDQRIPRKRHGTLGAVLWVAFAVGIVLASSVAMQATAIYQEVETRPESGPELVSPMLVNSSLTVAYNIVVGAGFRAYRNSRRERAQTSDATITKAGREG